MSDKHDEMARPIPDFDGYTVTPDGRVFSVLIGKFLSQGLTAKGYPRVILRVNGKTVCRTVHSLVAAAFIGPRPSGLQIAHLDGNKTNNHFQNLAYVTARENEAHKKLHGTVSSGNRNGAHTRPERRPRGDTHGNSKLNAQQVLAIRRALADKEIRWGVDSSVARQFGVTKGAVRLIRLRKTWRHI